MKKILLFSLYGRSGMWHYATSYANSLNNYETCAFVCPKYADKESVKNLELFQLTSRPKILQFLLDSLNVVQQIKIINYIRKEKFTSLHFLDNHPWSLGYMLIGRLMRKQIIVTQHDPFQHSGEGRRIFQDIINKLQRTFSDKLIVHGKYLKKKLVKDYPKLKNKVESYTMGHFGVVKQKTTVKFERKTMLFFGRILDYKGLDILLDALLLLNSIEYKLLLVGEGNLASYKKQLLKLKKKVEIHNTYVPDKKISEYFDTAAFIVLPYKDATQSGVVPVAYSHKMPVIVSNVGSIPESVDNHKSGIVVNPNAKELAKAIKYMLEKADIKKMGEFALKKMNRDMDWNKNTKKILGIYK